MQCRNLGVVRSDDASKHPCCARAEVAELRDFQLVTLVESMATLLLGLGHGLQNGAKADGACTSPRWWLLVLDVRVSWDACVDTMDCAWGWALGMPGEEASLQSQVDFEGEGLAEVMTTGCSKVERCVLHWASHCS